MSTQLARIAAKARADARVCFTSLAHVMTEEFLAETWTKLNRKGAAGVDRETIETYALNLDERLRDLQQRLKQGRYRAPPVRAVEIPKSNGKVRMLGIPTVEDRLVQAAVARLLKRNNLSLQDFDYYEIHEAFAGQVLCTLKAWEDDHYCKEQLGLEKALGPIDRSKMNVKGGSVALGHPFGATGARLVATMAKLLHQKGKGKGLISVCTAGGMGVAAIIEK